MNSNMRRNDIFSWLEEILDFPNGKSISLNKLHALIFDKVVYPKFVKSTRNETIREIVSSIAGFKDNGNFYLWPRKASVYEVSTDKKTFYEIHIGTDGISLAIEETSTMNRKIIPIAKDLIPWAYYDVRILLEKNGVTLGDDDINALQEDINTIIRGVTKKLSNKEVLKLIQEVADDPSWIDLIYTPFFAMAFACICHSVLSGEYAMDDSFSKRVRDLSGFLRESTIDEGNRNSWLNYLSECVITLSQILDEYNLFCIQIDTQVNKEPSAVLRKSEEYFDRHDYVNYFYKFMSNADGGFLNVNPMLLHFFQSFLEMARIDQNFYFSTKNFSSLMYLRELLNSGVSNDNEYNKKSGRGLVHIWEKYGNDSLIYDFQDPKDALELIKLKNDILLCKMWESCYDEIKDLTYVGQDKVLIFDPRKCREKEVGEEFHTELLLHDKLFDDDKRDKIQGFLGLTKSLIDETYSNKESQCLEGYEKEYIKALWGDEVLSLKSIKSYYNQIIKSQTSLTSLDIRHYNSKVIEMSRDAVFHTAELRVWIKHHKYDYNEAVAFAQIHKVLLFLQNHYSEGIVCYDSEMLEGYAKWCIGFLNKVSEKVSEPDSNRPSRIEEAILLLETVNGLLDRLITNIERGNYCLPFASKYRGCFFKYQKQKNVLERIFVDGSSEEQYKREKFESFISAGTSEEKWDEDKRENRVNIIFIASSFIPPLNIERLKTNTAVFVSQTHKLRNEIHAVYFNRLREYVKDDSVKQLEENRRSVVQILGIFAAFLALTTVALGASTANQSDLPFMSIMIGFTFCIAVFVGLLFFVTHTNIRRNIERQNTMDNISNSKIFEEVTAIIKKNMEEENVTKEKIEKDFANLKKEYVKIQKMMENIEKESQSDESKIKEIKDKISEIRNAIFETEYEQDINLEIVKAEIPKEIDKKIKAYKNKQKNKDNWKFWGPSILVSVILTVITILFLANSGSMEKTEPKEIKIDIRSSNISNGEKENVPQNTISPNPIFSLADIKSTTIPQTSQSVN